jgi:hypothetical protein
MDIGYTSKNLPPDHIAAISTSDEFQDKLILVLVDVLVDFTGISKVVPHVTSSIEYPAGFTTQDYLIILKDSISFIKSQGKSKKSYYTIPVDSLSDFSHTRGFLNNKIRFELKNPLRSIEFRIIDNQDFNTTVEIIRRICPPMDAEQVRQNKKISKKIPQDHVQAIMKSDHFSGKIIHGLFPCYFNDMKNYEFIKSESTISFSEPGKHYLVLTDEGITIILANKNEKKDLLSIHYSQISSVSLEKRRLTGITLIISPMGSGKNLEYLWMEKDDAETALHYTRLALRAQGKEIITGWFGGPALQWKERHGFDIIITNKRIVGKYNPEYEKQGYKTGLRSWVAGFAVAAVGGGTLPIGITMWALEDHIEHATSQKDPVYFNEKMLDQIDFQHVKSDISGFHIEFVAPGIFGLSIIEKSGISTDILIHGYADDSVRLISTLMDASPFNLS